MFMLQFVSLPKHLSLIDLNITYVNILIYFVISFFFVCQKLINFEISFKLNMMQSMFLWFYAILLNK